MRPNWPAFVYFAPSRRDADALAGRLQRPYRFEFVELGDGRVRIRSRGAVEDERAARMTSLPLRDWGLDSYAGPGVVGGGGSYGGVKGGPRVCVSSSPLSLSSLLVSVQPDRVVKIPDGLEATPRGEALLARASAYETIKTRRWRRVSRSYGSIPPRGWGGILSRGDWSGEDWKCYPLRRVLFDSSALTAIFETDAAGRRYTEDGVSNPYVMAERLMFDRSAKEVARARRREDQARAWASRPVRSDFEQLSKFLPDLKAKTKRLVWDSSVTDDIVQQTMRRAMKSWHTFKQGSNLRAWLFRIHERLMIDSYSRRKMIGTWEFSIDGTLANDTSEGDLSGHDVVASPVDKDELFEYELDDILTSLSRVRDDYRTALVLVDFMGWKYREVAEIIGVPLATVGTRVHRGRRELERGISSRKLMRRMDQSFEPVHERRRRT